MTSVAMFVLMLEGIVKIIRRWKLDLKQLILILVSAGIVLAVYSALMASYRVHERAFIKDTLAANQAYAKKLATVTELFLQSLNSQLRVSAGHIANHFDDSHAIDVELARLLTQTNSFDSLVVINAQRKIISAQPSSLALKGLTLDPSLSLPIELQQPHILDPFVSPAGNLLVSPTFPIFTPDGTYLGFIAGGIYLQGDTILNQLLGTHHASEHSYVYVVDKSKRLIYHKDNTRVGEHIPGNVAINAVLSGQSGAVEVLNSQGVDMLAGFAPVSTTGWGIISQRALTSIIAELNLTHTNVLYSTLPFALAIFVATLCAGFLIARPLAQLAQNVSSLSPGNLRCIDETPAWYFEAENLKSAILNSSELLGQEIRELEEDRKMDPLTKLNNRLAMQLWLDNVKNMHYQFSVMALDVDHFKSINDEFGHAVGDEVLCALASVMKKNARSHDFVCRSGGEEFLIFMPFVDANRAFSIAERLRIAISEHAMPLSRPVTVSIGIACWPAHSKSIDETLKMADKALYQAKNKGRNQTCQAKLSTHAANHDVARHAV
ncbi:sensor domain-containing diguanylate cyclase [Pseudoalteromonas sp. McH1-42]|uniref:sensor domain-containing diguanylate cyclase n=1 Tax=Pseudoalteromonas sp. McH1-42 TaxID=2917752 RepID=UPI001EF4F621|nr:sensor domain-containing diguanylate cyclase [Pseudoalteromonas sp. McH1-42]MCG7560002.1 sensor domain-containing diguanylate cyclase [Pseudoalteromonas sp. McH1-42]